MVENDGSETSGALVASLLGGGDWHQLALCAQVDTDIFFPEKGGSTRAAKLICGRCHVRAECLAEAIRNDERFGIRGGLSERERRRLSRGVRLDGAA